MTAENSLYAILTEKIKQKTLVLPTLPEVAYKVRIAADDPDIHLGQMSDLISQDPALSLGVVKVANSALLGRLVKVETVSQAVTRIGLRQIKSLSTAIVLEQVFVSKNETIAMYMNKYWMKSIDVASVAITLMTRYLKENKHANFSIDTMTLAALVHNIGVLPILTEAEHHTDVFANPTFLQQAISNLAGGLGGDITREWGLSAQFSTLAECWSDLTVLPKEAHYLDFIRAGAIKNGVFKNPSTQSSLLKSYVKKGILPDLDYMDNDEFLVECESVKQAFII